MALQYLFKLVLLQLILLGANGNLTKQNYYVLGLPKTKLLDENPLKMVVQAIGFLWPMNLFLVSLTSPQYFMNLPPQPQPNQLTKPVLNRHTQNYPSQIHVHIEDKHRFGD